MSDIKEAKRRIRKCLENQETELDLSNCGIEFLGKIPDIFTCTHIRGLDLSFNFISNIEQIGVFSKLERLNLNGNREGLILNGIENLSPLTGLSIFRSNVNDLTPLQYLTNLFYINAIENNIEDVSPIQNLINLKWIQLASNKIKDLTPLLNSPIIEDIDIRNNPIENFRVLLTNERYKKGELSVKAYNGETNLIFDVLRSVREGYPALKKYYDTLDAEGKIQNDQLKVILLVIVKT